MVKRKGWTSAAARIARDSAQLGELRRKVGLFAGSTAEAARAVAERAARTVAPSPERIVAAEARTAQDYRARIRPPSPRSAEPFTLSKRASTLASAG
jgi:hypothetical protein